MRLVTLDFEGVKSRFVLFEYEGQGRSLRLVKDDRARLLEGIASSEFFFDVESGALAKVKRDKYRGRKRPLRWLFRDYFEKRLMFQFEARKEIRSQRAVRAAGLVTPRCVAWGLSFNPFNRRGSLLLMEHVQDVVTGEQHFASLEVAGREAFLMRFCGDLMRLARAGYAHRDLHMNNLLCTPRGEIIWVDTHVRPLPRSKRGKWREVYRSISNPRLLDEDWREWLHQEMKRRWKAEPQPR